VLLLGILATLLFRWAPWLDPAVSALFHSADGFLFRGAPVAEAIHEGVNKIVPYGIAAAVVWLGIALWRRRDWQGPLFVILVLALGPGLLVNGLLKEHSGRARPVQVTQCGGDKSFTPAWTFTDQCRRNCSFVSGDVAVAFATLAPALLVTPARRRRLAITAALAFGGLVALVRLGQGAHFLSDVTFAGLITIAVVLALYLVMFPRRAAASARR
jgi:lipid A 4'-phosphatase